jgi:hypothetical protein
MQLLASAHHSHVEKLLVSGMQKERASDEKQTQAQAQRACPQIHVKGHGVPCHAVIARIAVVARIQ